MQSVPNTDISKHSRSASPSANPTNDHHHGFATNHNLLTRGDTESEQSAEQDRSIPANDAVRTGLLQLSNRGKDLKTGLSLVDLPSEILIHSLSHLSPADLLSTTLVCHRFHELVTHPDAWRTAFGRYFAGDASLVEARTNSNDYYAASSPLSVSKRYFTRLTTFSSWRAEYTIRVRLLRSLIRGRPITPADKSPTGKSRRSSNVAIAPVVLHDTQLSAPITLIHADFDPLPGRRHQNMLFASGFNGDARLMDPVSGKIDRSWLTWNDVLFRSSFEANFADHELYGMGSGQIVGNPNPVDVSRTYGVVVGEGFPAGRLSFRAVHERALQWLQTTNLTATQRYRENKAALGMPQVPTNREGISSVWIAKCSSVPSLSGGMIGIMSGSSIGIVSAYSLGHVGMRDRSITRGELTARWVLSPGVPITSLIVDDHYSLKRKTQNRIWAVAVNALGEVFYLTKFPSRTSVEKRPAASEKLELIEKNAWLSARSVHWKLIEPSRRTSTPDPYGDQFHDGSYTPRSSWNGMCLSDEQVDAETIEITKYLNRRPNEFRQECIAWDMQRKVEVDFAADDGNFAGETIFVVTNPSVQASKGVPGALRYVRTKTSRVQFVEIEAHAVKTMRNSSLPITNEVTSIFGSTSASDPESHLIEDERQSDSPVPLEEWWTSEFRYKSMIMVTCTTLDCSKIANLTMSEDPIITVNGSSALSSGRSSPYEPHVTVPDIGSIPGQRARFVAVGTETGMVYVWNIRAPLPRTQSYAHVIEPLRIIEAGKNNSGITCLAMNALAIVHGDEEGLVQAWDPLASHAQPIRTISSPFTGRMRRKLLEAEAMSDHDHSLASARCLVLDPDATSLRGMVAIGTYIKYWHFRTDDITGLGSRGGKRRRRKMSRSGNLQSSVPLGAGSRGGMSGFIEDEIRELTAERKREARERERLQQRFGVGMLGEDEELRLAMLLSEETFEFESQSERSTPRLSSMGPESPLNLSGSDEDLAQAIRRSLRETAVASPSTAQSASPSTSTWEGQVLVSRHTRRSPQGSSPSAQFASQADDEATDLELALMLSMAEQERIP